MGELWAAYSLGHVAFAGGSLVPCGGQNPLEPAFLGKPVLFGPSMENFKEPAALLLAAGGASQVDSPEKLAAELSRLLADSEAREAMGRAARGAIAARRGATEKAAGLIETAIASLRSDSVTE
jgi:3-deoxy-D-manno-octulosonic-acid transferase